MTEHDEHDVVKQAFYRIRMEQRKKEIEHAIGSQAFDDLILVDSASVVVGICGYAGPMGGEKYKEWIRWMMLNDPYFNAKVKAVESLVREYIGACKSKEEPSGNVD